MKQRETYDLPLLVVFGSIFFFVYIIQYTDGVFRSTDYLPQFMLPVAIFCGMYWDDRIGAVFGLIFGSFVDAVSANTVCYNSIVLMLIGYISGVLITKIINNNFRASLLLTFVFSLIYYFGYWCVSGFASDYILRIYPKTVLFTLIFSIPLYWAMKLIIKLREKTITN